MNENSSTIVVSPLMDSREIAAYLKVSESTLSRWRSAGQGPPFLRLGGIARYRIDAVDAWLASLEHGHAQEG
ncbi:helix-turn-helix transcriptional regulator [Microbacterium sp. J1-1]|uniref:helix-turn-helix transcriptional regulator n=1 Tax=Microbacterium sp. J1-1 TaxID=2992441 RepID=UPI0021155B9B|nr:helix-turn-helix domain-containing protein [Microbacterium sp. J1-1]UUE19401.1 helix-turn-helix domain-containing protein [Microbacterium sp. J1-1]